MALHRIPQQLRYQIDKALNMLLLAVKSKMLHFGVSTYRSDTNMLLWQLRCPGECLSNTVEPAGCLSSSVSRISLTYCCMHHLMHFMVFVSCQPVRIEAMQYQLGMLSICTHRFSCRIRAWQYKHYAWLFVTLHLTLTTVKIYTSVQGCNINTRSISQAASPCALSACIMPDCSTCIYHIRNRMRFCQHDSIFTQWHRCPWVKIRSLHDHAACQTPGI